MKKNLDQFRVDPDKTIMLSAWPTRIDKFYASDAQYKESIKKHAHELSELQQLHYASAHSALLVIFQGMDSAGKDGVIRHVMSGVNPQGCEVFMFKQPSAEELKHDFLWRTNIRLPERGRIGIFNRSYYEEVLVTRVHPELLKTAGLPESSHFGKAFWKARYHSIVELERHLHCNGTRVVKIFLHLSKNEQRERFLDRIKDQDKNWKFSLADINERSSWQEYMAAYEACLSATSTKHAPWYVVPADDKENARLIVSRILVTTLDALQMKYPKTSAKRHAELQTFKVRLTG